MKWTPERDRPPKQAKPKTRKRYGVKGRFGMTTWYKTEKQQEQAYQDAMRRKRFWVVGTKVIDSGEVSKVTR